MADDHFPITGRDLLMLRQKLQDAFWPQDAFSMLVAPDSTVTTATISLNHTEAALLVNLVGLVLSGGTPEWVTKFPK